MKQVNPQCLCIYYEWNGFLLLSVDSVCEQISVPPNKASAQHSKWSSEFEYSYTVLISVVCVCEIRSDSRLEASL